MPKQPGMVQGDDVRELGRRLREGDTRVVPALVRARARDELRASLTSSDTAVRADAAVGLARIGDEADLPALAALLDDPDVQRVARMCIERYGAAAVPHVLGRLSTGDAASLVALEALGAVGDERALGPMARVALESADEHGRRWAVEALAALAARHWDLSERVAATLDGVAAHDADPGLRDHARELRARLPGLG